MSLSAVLSGDLRYHVELGDGALILPQLPDNSVDSVVTDPPCGIAFMGASWDTDKGGRDSWIAWMTGIARECLRATKPGGHALVWALPRTSHWTAMAWENAGWEVRDKITHLNCLTPDTEILVNGQWVRHTECVESDLALCYDAEGDTFSWGPIQAVYESHYSDSLYSLRGDRTDQLVTRGHRCPVERGGTTVFVRAEDLAQEREARVPVLEDVREVLASLPLPHQGSSRPQHGLPSVREGGAEGTSTTNTETTSGLPNLRGTLHTEEQRRAGQCETLFSEMFWGSTLDQDPRGEREAHRVGSPRGGGMDRCLNVVVQVQDVWTEQSVVEGRCDHIQVSRELCRGEVRPVPTGVPADGPEGRVRDGAQAPGGMCSRSVSDTGRNGASCQPRPNGQPSGEPRSVQEQPGTQAVRASRFTTTDLVRIEPVPYTGIVWCVKVSTGAFVARRNGKVFVTGNSEGFPKSHNIAKALARRAGGPMRAREAIAWMQAERERLGLSRPDLEHRIFGRCDGNVRNWEEGISIPRPGVWPKIREALGYRDTEYDEDMERGDTLEGTVSGSFGYQANGQRWEKDRELRSPNTDLAKQWTGWGTGLKPASEDWWLLRKPCDQTTVAQNVLVHGTGALNIDGTRVQVGADDPILGYKIQSGRGFGVSSRIYGKPGSGAPAYDGSKGRHPANLLVSHHPACVGRGTPPEVLWDCHPDCAALALDNQSKNEVGGARFFNNFACTAEDDPAHASFIFTPKPSQTERHEGLPPGGNEHPTVKSIALMHHLVTLITPPGGVVLDSFAGSGTTGIAVLYHSPTTRFIGMEQDPKSHGSANARLAYHLVKSQGGVPNPFTENSASKGAESIVALDSLEDLFGG